MFAMILNFYRLTEPPFGVTPDPRFLYLGKTHREALASVLYGLTAGRGFMTLIAGPGMGKTTLLYLLLQELQPTTRTAFLSHAHCSARELLVSLLTSLGIEDSDDSFLEMHKKLNDTLLRDHNSLKRFVVIIDEAQNLMEPTLELLRVLSNVETPRDKLMHFILAGHPLLAEKLASPQLIQLRQRVSIFAMLEPFDAEETRAYIDHRLRVAGYDFAKPMFTQPALDLIARNTQGVPRNINNVCFHALSLGFEKKHETIDVDVVLEVLKDLDLRKLMTKESDLSLPPEASLSDKGILDTRLEPNTATDSGSCVLSDGGASTPIDADRVRHLEFETAPSDVPVPVSPFPPDADLRLCSGFESPISPAGDPPVTAVARVPGLSGSSVSLTPSESAPVTSATEVTVSPSQPQRFSPNEPSNESELKAAKTELLPLTLEQNLPIFQDELRQTVDRVARTAIESHVDESLRSVLGRIDEVWKTNLSESEKFSAARLAEVQEYWAQELAAYRIRAEETSRRMEILDARAGKCLQELQTFVEQIKNEIEPQLRACVNDSLVRATSEFETMTARVSEQHQTHLDQTHQEIAREARSQFDEMTAEMRSLLAITPASIREERLESLLESSRGAILEHVGERVKDLCSQFEGKEEVARHRADELSQQLEKLTTELHQAQIQHDQSLANVQSLVQASKNSISQELFESQMQSEREQILSHLEGRVNEISSRAEQQQILLRQRMAEVVLQLENLAAEARNASSRHEQGIAELGSRFAGVGSSVSQEHLDVVLNSTREQFFNHLECRLGEIVNRFDQRQEAARQEYQEILRRLEQLAIDTRTHLHQTRELAEQAPRELLPQSLSAIEQAAENAVKHVENSALLVSDRQLVRMMEEKQAMARELSLDLEARACETRVQLEKAGNSALDEFRRRLEFQSDLMIAETAQRVTSTLASLDAEYRAAREANHRTLKAELTRTTEQCTAEFRSSMKAFLYSCLVAAVGAVDQHAKNTLGGLSNDLNDPTLRLDVTSDSSAKSENSFSANSASFLDPRGD